MEHMIIQHEQITIDLIQPNSKIIFNPQKVCCQNIFNIFIHITQMTKPYINHLQSNDYEAVLYLCYKNSKQNLKFIIENNSLYFNDKKYNKKYYSGIGVYLDKLNLTEPLYRTPNYFELEINFKIPFNIQSSYKLELNMCAYNLLRIYDKNTANNTEIVFKTEQEISRGLLDSSQYHDTIDWKIFFAIYFFYMNFEVACNFKIHIKRIC